MRDAWWLSSKRAMVRKNPSSRRPPPLDSFHLPPRHHLPSPEGLQPSPPPTAGASALCAASGSDFGCGTCERAATLAGDALANYCSTGPEARALFWRAGGGPVLKAPPCLHLTLYALGPNSAVVLTPWHPFLDPLTFMQTRLPHLRATGGSCQGEGCEYKGSAADCLGPCSLWRRSPAADFERS